MISILLVLIVFQVTTASIILDCKYSTQSWFPIGSFYTCNAQLVQIGKTKDVVGVSQNHESAMADQDVRALKVVNQMIDFFPEGIESSFGNLEVIHFAYVPIKSMMAEDLKPFPKLKYFAVEFGQLSTINGDLFVYSPELQLVSFFSNKIESVGPGIFDRCPKLAFVYFQHNLCIKDYIDNDATAIQNIAKELSFKCQPTEEIKMLDDKNNSF